MSTRKGAWALAIGERILLARKRVQLSQQALADRAGDITKQSISKYEHDRATPTSGVLLRLAQAMGVTVDSLLRPTTIELPQLKFRKLQRLRVKQMEALEAHAQEALERQLTLERIVYGENRPGFTGVEELPVDSEEDAEETAGHCRDALSLGSDPIANLTETLENWHVRVIRAPVRVPSFDGVSQWIDHQIPFIMVGDDPSKSGDRQRMTLAHELAHLVCRYAASVDEETAAYRFAGALLAPKHAVVTELGESRSQIDWRELLRLKLAYGISMKALVFRARDCGVVTAAIATRMWKDYSKQGWTSHEPGEVPMEAPDAMEKLLDRALAEGLISASRAAELSGMSLREFQDQRARTLPENVRGY